MKRPQSLGADYRGEGRCHFQVWSPLARKVDVHILAPREKTVPLAEKEKGYFQVLAEDVQPGSLYLYRLDGGKERPDPASRYQPQGVHGPSQVIDLPGDWEDGCWCGRPLEEYILYELHVGTFTPKGTMEAVVPHLDLLRDLGITALELMPVAQFPGARNWGYDGVYPFAVQNSYGGPQGLRKLVQACHRRGLAVVLDLVCNHLGPEGNYLRDFAPYFTDRYRTPWGEAVNFDGPHSDEVRRFFIENALYWITDFHIDGLRLDAVHAILDHSASPFLRELAAAVHRRGEALHRKVHLFAESDDNDAGLIRSPGLGGYGLDGHWNEDFHHALHTLLTGERSGCYMDFGRMEHLYKAYGEGFFYSGRYSQYRRRRHGSYSRDLPPYRFVVFSQNHDQVGNRMLGERLTQLVSFDGLKLAAGVVLLSPSLPLLFMGEEYGETAPFLYFIDHSDPQIIEAVSRGRRREFSAFAWKGEPAEPHEEGTFLRSRLQWSLRGEGRHRILQEFYRELISLRRTLPPVGDPGNGNLEVGSREKEKILWVRRWNEEQEVFIFFHFGEDPTQVSLPVPAGLWVRKMDSEDELWGGRGSSLPGEILSDGEITLTLAPKSFAVFACQTGA